MESLEANLADWQWSEALTGRQRCSVGAQHITSEVTRDENRFTHRRRVISSRHQIHLRRELAGPCTDGATKIEVEGDALLTVVANPNR